jgi:SAM-dependent methyltransferase
MYLLPNENDLTGRHTSCPNCNLEINNNNKVLVQSNPIVSMFKCNKCFLAFTNFFPSEEFLEKLYKPKQYKSHLTTNIIKTKELAIKIEKKIQINKKKITILDFGGGNGKLALELIALFKKRNIEAEGLVVDLYKNFDDVSLQFLNTNEFINNNCKFDLVLASAVLEHLPNFIEVKKKLINSVEQGGYFYARTPWDFDLSKLTKFYKVKWPRHLYDIGGDYWNNYFEENKNLKIVFSETSPIEIEKKFFIHYYLAFILKSISKLEIRLKKLFNSKSSLIWKLVGGWEVLIKKDD